MSGDEQARALLIEFWHHAQGDATKTREDWLIACVPILQSALHSQAQPVGWSDKIPQVDGWYWYKNEFRRPSLPPIVRHVTPHDLRYGVWAVHGEWSGPIPEPPGAP